MSTLIDQVLCSDLICRGAEQMSSSPYPHFKNVDPDKLSKQKQGVQEPGCREGR